MAKPRLRESLACPQSLSLFAVPYYFPVPINIPLLIRYPLTFLLNVVCVVGGSWEGLQLLNGFTISRFSRLPSYPVLALYCASSPKPRTEGGDGSIPAAVCFMLWLLLHFGSLALSASSSPVSFSGVLCFSFLCVA